ncbi:MAG TPA: CoA transferase [Dehalococcoidia bacterium]|nr:CoA transferase [Dehalococcoidia bacterium]
MAKKSNTPKKATPARKEKALPPMLDQYRVLDLTDDRGALCGKVLAEMGADVIKVEKPGGDFSRSVGPFYQDTPDPEKSLNWFAFNQNKRGITLNIETRDGQELLRKLVKKADFVIESFKPGYMDKLGLGYKALSKVNPRIIMTSITPFGQTGPYSRFNGPDLVTMAMAGYSFICGDPDRPPVRFSSDQSYYQGSLQAAVGTLMAHYYRELSGEGQHVDVSMQESMVWTLCYAPHDWYLLHQNIHTREGSLWKRLGVTYRLIWPCKDGYVCYRLLMAQPGAEVMNDLIASMNKEGLGKNMKDISWTTLSFTEVPQERINEWEAEIGKYFLRHTKSELHEEAVRQRNVLQPVNNAKDLYESPQLAARDFWVEIEHPELGDSITYPGPYFKSTETAWRKGKRAPLIGEHNEDIYTKELGLTKDELAVLKRENVI